MKPSVYITFDVECSMGGAWGPGGLKPVPPSRAMMGEYGDRKLGLPLICDILERNGLSATHFVEAFTEEQGFEGQTRGICTYLVDRGQDVQLHIHPNHKHYGDMLAGREYVKCDQMADLPAGQQRDLLVEGARRIRQWTQRPCTSFRAGNMGASEETLAQMPEAGLGIDSSYTFCYLDGQCRFADSQAYNGSKWYGEVLELALSGFRQPRLPGLRAAKPLDLVGISFQECRDGIRQICDAGADAVIILHSFSLMKVRDVQYSQAKENRVIIRRFEKLCRWLARNRESYPTRTFNELAEDVAAGRYEPKAVAPHSRRRPLRALVRKSVQLYNQPYCT
jgi:hypothetical protein